MRKLQRFEVQRASLAITISPSSTQRTGNCERSGSSSSGKVAVERFLVAALDQDLVAVAKHQRAKSIPLRLEDPVPPRGNSPTRLASIGKTGGFTGRCIPQSYTA